MINMPAYVKTSCRRGATDERDVICRRQQLAGFPPNPPEAGVRA